MLILGIDESIENCPVRKMSLNGKEILIFKSFCYVCN